MCYTGDRAEKAAQTPPNPDWRAATRNMREGQPPEHVQAKRASMQRIHHQSTRSLCVRACACVPATGGRVTRARVAAGIELEAEGGRHGQGWPGSVGAASIASHGSLEEGGTRAARSVDCGSPLVGSTRAAALMATPARGHARVDAGTPLSRMSPDGQAKDAGGLWGSRRVGGDGLTAPASQHHHAPNPFHTVQPLHDPSGADVPACVHAFMCSCVHAGCHACMRRVQRCACMLCSCGRILTACRVLRRCRRRLQSRPARACRPDTVRPSRARRCLSPPPLPEALPPPPPRRWLPPRRARRKCGTRSGQLVRGRKALRVPPPSQHSSSAPLA